MGWEAKTQLWIWGRRPEVSALRIYALGGFQVYKGHDFVCHFSTRNTEKLLCYLVLNRHRFHPREVLAELFWGKSRPKNTRHCLRTALWRLRSVLEDSYVSSD